MPESGGASIEIAHKLAEEKNSLASGASRWHEVLEIVEAIVLAVVAVATATARSIFVSAASTY